MFDRLRALGRTYALYWSGTLLMQLSTQVFLVIVAWKLTNEDPRHDYSFLIYALSNVPFVVLTFAAALLARRWSYRQVHLLGQALMVTSVAVFVVYLGSGQIALSLIAVLIWNAGIALRGPAYQATIAAMFQRNERSTAYAYHDVAVNASRLIGPLLASWMLSIERVAFWPVLALSSITTTVLAITTGDKHHSKDASRRPLITRDLKAWRRLSFVMVVSAMFISNQTLLPALVRQNGGSVTDLAILVSVGSIGAILGSISQEHLLRLLRQWEKPVLIAVAMLCYTAVGLTDLLPLWLTAAFLSGAAGVVLFLRLKTDFLLLGQRDESVSLLSSYFFASYLGYSLGSLLWGALAQQTSPQFVFLLVAVAMLILLPTLFASARAPARTTARGTTPD